LVGPHEGSISRPEQKFRIDQGAQKRVTGGTIKAPQPLRLRRGQAKSRHLDVLTLDTPQHVVMRSLRCHIRCFSLGSRDCRDYAPFKSNAYATLDAGNPYASKAIQPAVNEGVMPHQ